MQLWLDVFVIFLRGVAETEKTPLPFLCLRIPFFGLFGHLRVEVRIVGFF